MKNFDGEVIHKGKIHQYKKNCPIYITSSWGALCNGMMGFLRDKVGNKLFIEVDGQMHEVKTGEIDFVPGFSTTIHKCQSKTWPGVNIYLSKKSIINERTKLIRLVYVALTRVRHFDKCYISLYN
jgi:ATP-dependent exoDNAse (exonuclease V) alpha subunit